MMNARLNKALVALLAVGFAGACDDPPIDLDSDAVRLATNPSFVVIEAGETRLVQAYLVNASGNTVSGSVDYEACNAAITVTEDENQSDVEPGTNFNITGNTLGTSCVTVSGGGFEETIGVRVVPADLALTLTDTILSGASATAGVTFLNASGGAASGFDLDEVNFVSLDTLIAVIDPATGEVTARAPGTARIVVRLNSGLGAARADTFPLIVVPGAFAGTITPGSGNAGQQVTLEFAAGDPLWDANSSITIQSGFDEWTIGEGAFVLTGSDSNTVVTTIPYGASAGTATIILTGLGPNQIALAETFTVNAASANDPYEPNDIFAGDPIPTIPVPFDQVLFADGTDVTDVYRIILPVADTLNLHLDWDDEHGSHDLDLYVANATFTVAHCSAATANHPENIATCSLAAGTYYIWVDNYDPQHGGSPGPTNYRLRIRN